MRSCLDPGDQNGSGEFQVQVTPLYETPVQLDLTWLTDQLWIDHVSDHARRFLSAPS